MSRAHIVAALHGYVRARAAADFSLGDPRARADTFRHGVETVVKRLGRMDELLVAELPHAVSSRDALVLVRAFTVQIENYIVNRRAGLGPEQATESIAALDALLGIGAVGDGERPDASVSRRGGRPLAFDQDAPRAVAGSKGFDGVQSTQDTRACEDTGMTVQYLSLQDVADHLGVSRNTVAKLRLPEPDVRVGSGHNAPRGWSVDRIDEWNANRPGSGNWGKREKGDDA